MRGLMDSNHYTPTIEEFHIGFELEYYDGDSDSWKPLVISKDTYDWDSWGAYHDDKTHPFSSYAKFRVKYLDRGDIESFGYVRINFYDDGKGPASYRWEKDHVRIYLLSKQFVRIEYDSGVPLFEGTIKNKSELKRILVQLGIK